MKLKRYEIYVLSITALLLIFTIGFFFGRSMAKSSITVSPQIQKTEHSYANTPSSDLADNTSDKTAIELPDAPVNINTADAALLATLPGIGETIAQRIIAYREDFGDFESIEELLYVDGIGEAKLEELRSLIVIE